MTAADVGCIRRVEGAPVANPRRSASPATLPSALEWSGSPCDCRRAKNSAGDNGDDSDAHGDILAAVTTAVSKNRVIAPDRRVLHPMVCASACHQEQREPTKHHDTDVFGPRTLSADRAVRW